MTLKIAVLDWGSTPHDSTIERSVYCTSGNVIVHVTWKVAIGMMPNNATAERNVL